MFGMRKRRFERAELNRVATRIAFGLPVDKDLEVFALDLIASDWKGRAML